MKNTLMFTAILFTALSSAESKAQVHVDINIGRPPVYATPVSRVQYYYLPEEQIYYYVPKKRYYYRQRGNWVSASNYRGCNVNKARRVAVYERQPYLHHDYYRSRYSVYRTAYYDRDQPDYKGKKYKGHRGKHND
jgi:hypothetical protein